MVSDVEKERSRADTRVEAAVGVAPERIPAHSSVCNSGGEAKKGVLALGRVEPGIAAIWRWHYRLRSGSGKVGEQGKRTKERFFVFI